MVDDFDVAGSLYPSVSSFPAYYTRSNRISTNRAGNILGISISPDPSDGLYIYGDPVVERNTKTGKN